MEELLNMSAFARRKGIDYDLFRELVHYFKPPVEKSKGNEKLYEYKYLKSVWENAERAKLSFQREMKPPKSNDNLKRLRDLLVEEGRKKMRSKPRTVQLAHDEAADRLLNDFDHYPHAFLIGCLMDRQVKAQIAWMIPYKLFKRLGFFDFLNLYRLCQKEPEKIVEVMNKPTPVHRFTKTMTDNLFAAIKIIAEDYDGDASKIWSGNPRSETIVNRLLKFPGIGQKISTMATNKLAQDFGIEVSDRSAIDISVDIHIARVFPRMGFVPLGSSNDEIITRARELNPEYPGIFDAPLWDCGHTVCTNKHPDCENCKYSGLCAQHY